MEAGEILGWFPLWKPNLPCCVLGTERRHLAACADLSAAARRRGAFTAEINPETTEASGSVDLAIPERAEGALPEIDRLLSAARG